MTRSVIPYITTFFVGVSMYVRPLYVRVTPMSHLLIPPVFSGETVVDH